MADVQAWPPFYAWLAPRAIIRPQVSEWRCVRIFFLLLAKPWSHIKQDDPSEKDVTRIKVNKRNNKTKRRPLWLSSTKKMVRL